MTVFILVLRVIHVLAGVMWAGGSIFMSGLIAPTVSATGEVGQKFVQHLSLKSNFSNFMAVNATSAFLSGLIIYIILWSNSNGGYLSSGRGLTITIGSTLGFIAWLYGFINIGRTTSKMKALSEEMAAASGPPKPEKLQQMQAMGAQVSKAGPILTLLLLVTIIFMASAEYVF